MRYDVIVNDVVIGEAEHIETASLIFDTGINMPFCNTAYIRDNQTSGMPKVAQIAPPVSEYDARFRDA
jgi:hypothetical protein